LTIPDWWIVSRGNTWGPFDYQWSTDLRGIEFTYRGNKFGEICGEDEFFADLAPFRLPISVYRVDAVIAGSFAAAISCGDGPEARMTRLLGSLRAFGYGRFDVRSCDGSAQPAPDARRRDSTRGQ